MLVSVALSSSIVLLMPDIWSRTAVIDVLMVSIADFRVSTLPMRSASCCSRVVTRDSMAAIPVLMSDTSESMRSLISVTFTLMISVISDLALPNASEMAAS